MNDNDLEDGNLDMAAVVEGMQEELINEIVNYCFHDETLDAAGLPELDVEYIFVSRKELASSIKRALNQPKEE